MPLHEFLSSRRCARFASCIQTVRSAATIFDSSLLLDDHVMEGCPMDSDLTPDISMDTNIGSDTDEEVSLILFDFLFCWLENAVCATQTTRKMHVIKSVRPPLGVI